MSWYCRKCSEYYSRGNPCFCWLETHSLNNDDYYLCETQKLYETYGHFFKDKNEANDYCYSKYGCNYDTCESASNFGVDPMYFKHIMEKND